MERAQEQRAEEERMEAWNESTDFGQGVDEGARRLERERREQFETRLLRFPVTR